MKVRTVAVAGVLALALVALAACGGDDDKLGATATTTETHSVGDVVRLGDVEVTVKSFKDPFDSGNQAVKAPAGFRQVAVEVEVKNLSSDPKVFSGFSQFEMRDSTNKSFGAIPLPGNIPSLGGAAQPQTARSGVVGFQVPEGATGLQVVFTAPLVSEGSVTYNVP